MSKHGLLPTDLMNCKDRRTLEVQEYIKELHWFKKNIDLNSMDHSLNVHLNESGSLSTSGHFSNCELVLYTILCNNPLFSIFSLVWHANRIDFKYYFGAGFDIIFVCFY